MIIVGNLLLIYYYICTLFSQISGIENVGRIFFTIPWNHNFDFQFAFIKYCIENNKIMPIFETCSEINLNKEVPEWTKCLHEQTIDLASICWKYNALYWILLELSKKEKLLPVIEDLFVQKPLEQCPDLLIFALIKQSGANNTEHTKLIRSLMIKAIKKIIYPGSNTSYHNNSSLIIQKLWSTGNVGPSINSTTLIANQKILLESLVELYNQSTAPDEQTNKLLRILEISQDLKALNHLLNDSSYLFVIDLASVASRREYLKLDKWINDKLTTIGQPFADACKFYVQQRSAKPESTKKLATPSHRETLSTITSCLENYYSMIKEATYSTNMKDMFKIYAELDSVNNNIKGASNEDNQNSFRISSSNSYHSLDDDLFDKKTQQLAIGILKNVLTQTNLKPAQFEKIINVFENMKQSNDCEHQNIFNCMVQKLLKELDFLSKYQKNELINIGELIGGIINRSLVDTNLLSFILQKLYYIINASKKEQKLVYFVLRVIERCKTRLQEYPALFEKLLSTDLLKLGNVAQISTGNNENQSQRITNQSSLKKEQPSLLPNNQEFLFRERLNFIFNNLDRNNLQSLATQLIQDCSENIRNYEILSEILTCRAISEANHHELFYDFLVTIDSIKIFDSVAVKSYEKIRMYLLKIESSDLKKKLYSAGKWIGMVTLQRNKPILSLYLDLHNLLIEADVKNLTFHVVPFVVQVLYSCGKSKVFRPPNPWLMTLLQLLTEIYIKPDSKLKIKFDIEKLYKVLELELDDYKDISPNNEKKKAVSKYCEYLKPFVMISPESDNSKEPKISAFPTPISSQTIGQSVSHMNEIDFFKDLVNQIRISSQLRLIQCHPELVVIFKKLIVKAIQEWLSTWAEKPNIFITAVEVLVRKDFAFESDPEKLRNAAINFTRYALTGYTLMKCHESLSITISDMLCEFLCKDFKLHQLMCDRKFIKDTIFRIVHENINCCIIFIEKCLIKKSIEEICNRIQPDIEKRLKEKDNGQKYINKSYFDNNSIRSTFYNTFDSTQLKIKLVSLANNLPVNDLTEEKVQPSVDLLSYNQDDRVKVAAILEKWFHFFHVGQKNHEDIQNFIAQIVRIFFY